MENANVFGLLKRGVTIYFYKGGGVCAPAIPLEWLQKMVSDKIIGKFPRDKLVHDAIDKLEKMNEKMYGKDYESKSAPLRPINDSPLSYDENIQYAIDVLILLKFEVIPNDDKNGIVTLSG